MCILYKHRFNKFIQCYKKQCGRINLIYHLEAGILEGGFESSIASYYGEADIKVKNYGLKKEFMDMM